MRYQNKSNIIILARCLKDKICVFNSNLKYYGSCGSIVEIITLNDTDYKLF